MPLQQAGGATGCQGNGAVVIVVRTWSCDASAIWKQERQVGHACVNRFNRRIQKSGHSGTDRIFAQIHHYQTRECIWELTLSSLVSISVHPGEDQLDFLIQTGPLKQSPMPHFMSTRFLNNILVKVEQVEQGFCLEQAHISAGTLALAKPKSVHRPTIHNLDEYIPSLQEPDRWS